MDLSSNDGQESAGYYSKLNTAKDRELIVAEGQTEKNRNTGQGIKPRRIHI